ncbi:MAG: alpha/beta hydrolase [Bacteroidales bacterium]|nr:alpha/beta hydrolase [Bacteroidales bacterium]
MAKRGVYIVFFIFWMVVSWAQDSSISGVWDGYLKLGNDSLRLVLVMDIHGNDVFAVLDSPDQYMTDMPIDEIRFSHDTLKFKEKKYNISYQGVMQSDSSFKGKFTQMGKTRSLILHPHAKRKLFLRPQEPQPPYPYEIRDVQWRTIPPIEGTLTLPQGQKTRAALILISGSGHQDRDETLMAHKPFKLLADTLTRNGFAVYRYDDAAPLYFKNMTTFDFVEQVQKICDSLAQIPELYQVPIGLLGHSEGGLVACIAASQCDKIQFVVSLAGIAEPIKEILLYQNRVLSEAENLETAQIEKNMTLSKKIYEIMEKAKTKEMAQRKLSDFLLSMTSKMTLEQKTASHLTPTEVLIMQQQLLTPWYYTLFHIKPSLYIKKVKCPILVLNGDKDRQVDAAANLSLFTNYLIANKDVTIRKIQGVNHLFQPCQTGMPSEYGEIEQTFSSSVMTTIIHWLKERY